MGCGDSPARVEVDFGWKRGQLRLRHDAMDPDAK